MSELEAKNIIHAIAKILPAIMLLVQKCVCKDMAEYKKIYDKLDAIEAMCCSYLLKYDKEKE